MFGFSPAARGVKTTAGRPFASLIVRTNFFSKSLKSVSCPDSKRAWYARSASVGEEEGVSESCGVSAREVMNKAFGRKVAWGRQTSKVM